MLHDEIRYKNEQLDEYIKQNKSKLAKIANLEKDLKNTKLQLS